MDSSRSSKLVLAGLAGSLVLAIATIAFLSWPKSPSPPVGECPPKVKELTDKAEKLQEATFPDFNMAEQGYPNAVG